MPKEIAPIIRLQKVETPFFTETPVKDLNTMSVAELLSEVTATGVSNVGSWATKGEIEKALKEETEVKKMLSGTLMLAIVFSIITYIFTIEPQIGEALDFLAIILVQASALISAAAVGESYNKLKTLDEKIETLAEDLAKYLYLANPERYSVPPRRGLLTDESEDA